MLVVQFIVDIFFLCLFFVKGQKSKEWTSGIILAVSIIYYSIGYRTRDNS